MRRFARLLRRGCRDTAGSTMVEFALIVFPVILLALGTFDYFATSYEITTLEGAARGIGEYARDSSVCGGPGFTDTSGNPTTSPDTACASGMNALFTAMKTNSTSLASANFTAPGSTTAFYTCTDNTPVPKTGVCAPASGDTRIIGYVLVTVKQPWWQLFPWDPWSSKKPLTARMSTRFQ